MEQNRTRSSRSGGSRRNYSSSARPARSGGRRPATSGGGRARGGGRGGASRGHGGGRRGGNGGGRKMPTFNPSQFINKNPVEVVEEVYTPTHMFKDFGLDHKLVRTISEMNIATPSPIQDQIIPHILEGRDVIGLAQTGTGKTAAFLVPLIEKTNKEYRRQTLILAPTRELAIQIDEELKKLSKGYKLFSTICVGGTSMGPQVRGLKRHNHFIIGTPGRILDHIERRNLKVDKITTVVLDEADRMLDMGFINDMRSILSGIPADHETLFFSATMDAKTEGLVHDFLRDPVTVSVRKKDVTDSIEQDIVPYSADKKLDVLLDLLADEAEFKRVILFTDMKHKAERIAREIARNGVKSDSIHGNKSHGQRQRSLARFKSGNARVLVATDVAARGIHVDNVSHVINYELPQTFEDYVHRIGRTGRGTKRGKALTFVPAEVARRS